ncbi:SDR family oxidoreductase [Gluconacetobacter tumulicola]|uniref:SDR family oxidoreductase n=1 Tax=Gluconacetobacter tumulicola TaxID=1017177 RepID=A0A7W4JEC6_9PROT|nr:SDR family oxidoreductase [Gluconacetobacter tumulicola]
MKWENQVPGRAAGKCICITSAGGEVGALLAPSTTRNCGSSLTAAFNATNAAMTSLTRSAAIALAAHGIRINGIAPGPLRMPMWHALDAAFAAAEGEGRQDQERHRLHSPEAVRRGVGSPRRDALPRFGRVCLRDRPDNRCRWRPQTHVIRTGCNARSLAAGSR